MTKTAERKDVDFRVYCESDKQNVPTGQNLNPDVDEMDSHAAQTISRKQERSTPWHGSRSRSTLLFCLGCHLETTEEEKSDINMDRILNRLYLEPINSFM